MAIAVKLTRKEKSYGHLHKKIYILFKAKLRDSTRHSGVPFGSVRNGTKSIYSLSLPYLSGLILICGVFGFIFSLFFIICMNYFQREFV